MTLNEEQKTLYNELGMAEKVAILLIQLGEDATANLFSHMDIDVVTNLSKRILPAKISTKP